jgi:hypothetical protein
MQFLFGLVHGHFAVSSSAIETSDVDESAGQSLERINTGIAIVVPFHSIDAVIKAYETRKAG